MLSFEKKKDDKISKTKPEIQKSSLDKSKYPVMQI